MMNESDIFSYSIVICTIFWIGYQIAKDIFQK